MSTIKVETSKTYNIYIEKDFNNLKEAVYQAGVIGRALIVTDSNVSGLYLRQVRGILGEILDVSSLVFTAGEERKNLDTVKHVYQTCMSRGFDRKSAIIALGGGVCGDLSGFAAATYMRGIKFVQLPTTLLSQVDSSVGGKTGVDFMEGKNVVGAFHQPELVYANISALKTLPKQEFSSGMGEVIKHGLIMNREYYQYIEENKEKIKSLDLDSLLNVVEGSCKIKASVVKEDEKEQGIREILNFGHTFGHAIESLSGYTIAHGKCVGLGMAAALKLSLLKGFVCGKDMERAEKLLQYFSVPSKTRGFSPEDIYQRMFYDKKTKGGKLTFILLKEIGSAFSLSNVEERLVRESIEYIIKEQP